MIILKMHIMKNLLTCMLVLIALKVASQGNVSTSLGFGLPELLNAGVRYELQPVRFGVSAGTAFSGAYSFTGDFYYHFAGSSNQNELQPWYFRTTISYWQLRQFWFIDLGNVVLLGFRVGRDFSFSEESGISLDGGIVPLSFFSGKKIPFSFIPSFGATLYYRFGSR